MHAACWTSSGSAPHEKSPTPPLPLLPSSLPQLRVPAHLLPAGAGEDRGAGEAARGDCAVPGGSATALVYPLRRAAPRNHHAHHSALTLDDLPHVTPIFRVQSGIQMIPMMLGLPVGAIVSGIIVTKTGAYRWAPFLGGAGLTIACWLYTTMSVHTPVGDQVGYLILGGLSMGLLVQIPLLGACGWRQRGGWCLQVCGPLLPRIATIKSLTAPCTL